MKAPKLSIVCITYNQEKYIAQAIDSFFSQNIDFNIEIIVADDGSTDLTPSIIRSYKSKSNINIKPVLRKKNIGIQSNFKNALERARGQYIAICEGDDFWTDSSKLQKQVDFLDSHPEHDIVFHPVSVFFEDSSRDSYTFPDSTNDLSVERLAKENFIQTNSVVYRKKNYRNLSVDALPYDWYLHLYHASSGKIGFIDKTMSAYRVHDNGVWWDSHTSNNQIWIKHGIAQLTVFTEALKMYEDNHEVNNIIMDNIITTLRNFISIDASENTHLLSDSFNKRKNEMKVLVSAVSKLVIEDSKIKLHQVSRIEDLEKNLSQR